MSASPEPGRRLPSANWISLPSWLLVALVVLPLAAGTRTLYYRDILDSHYPLKTAQAQLQEGRLEPALIDPYRGGGQPLLGNPNAVPYYPSNVLYRVAQPLWALNAHFWLHWLLAPLSGFWLGRSFRLRRSAAWVCGIAWATGGYFLSTLNLYNLVATAALAPALVAAFVDLARSRAQARRRMMPAALLTGLVFLGGDPVTAALVYLLAAAAWLVTAWPARRPVADAARSLLPAGLRALGAAVLGAALASPVWVELLRILPTSYRGFWSHRSVSSLTQSWHPATWLDWWIPGVFGSFDLTFWGSQLFGGHPPLFLCLSPGWIVVALAVTAGVSRRRRTWRRSAWAWGAVALGLFLALGSHNPLLREMTSWPGASLLRYPVKAWLAAALGLSLLAGVGFERLAAGARRGVFLGALAAILAGSVLLRLAVSGPSMLTHWLSSLAPDDLVGPFLVTEMERWQASLALSSFAVGLALLVTIFARRRPRLLALLLVVHTGSQLLLHRQLLATDEASLYRPPFEIAEYLPGLDRPSQLQVEHGGFDDHFGPQKISAQAVPSPSLKWWSRARFQELSHIAGVSQGFEYPFVRSPEGLDSFVLVALGQALPRLDDAARVRLLELAGVDVLVVDRPLEAGAAGKVRLLGRMRSVGRTVHVYGLPGAAAEVSLATRPRGTGDLKQALEILTDPAFDPRTEVVLPERDVWPSGADGPAPDPRVAQVDVLDDQVERLLVDVESTTPAWLVVRRAWLPLWRAEVDGEPAEVLVADGYQMAVAVPGGQHQVRLYLDRRPTRLALLSSVLALLACAWLWLRPPARQDRDLQDRDLQDRDVQESGV